MRNLIYGKETASENVIMHNEQVPAEKKPMRELREIARVQEKPSPKLQPVNTSNQSMRIIQPL